MTDSSSWDGKRLRGELQNLKIVTLNLYKRKTRAITQNIPTLQHSSFHFCIALPFTAFSANRWYRINFEHIELHNLHFYQIITTLLYFVIQPNFPNITSSSA